MTTIYLIRHGDLEYPTNEKGQRLLYGPDVLLSDKGRKQIQDLSERFVREGRKLEKIYTSPFHRAVETAEIIAAHFQLLKPTQMSDFRDISHGSMLGALLDDVVSGKLLLYPESHEEVLKRMMQGMQKVVGKEAGKSIGIVSHGDSIRVLMFRLMHPTKTLPPIMELIKSDYIDKGEAWRIVVDNSLRLVEREYIGRPPEVWGKGERKS